MALKADTMEVELASALLGDMTTMIKEEEELRVKIKKIVSFPTYVYLPEVKLFIN